MFVSLPTPTPTWYVEALTSNMMVYRDGPWGDNWGQVRS